MKNLNKNEQVCSVCQSEPQDMLILSCRHNLCLDCATEVYNLNSKEDKIICEICLSDTSLDEDTIVCLRSLSAKNIKESRMDSYDYPIQQNRQNFPPIPRSTYSNYARQQLPLIQQQQEASTIRCQKHQQPLTYYCLECNSFRICSQCMLLQNHRFHKVVTLRKASIQIKQTIQKVGRQKLKLKNLLQKDMQSLTLRKQESQKQLQTNIRQLKCTFDQINKLILQKYQQLKKRMEEQAGRKLEIMQGAVNQIEQKIQLIEETVQFQDELIKSAVNNQCTSANTFQMFQYYESQMAQNKVDFQPRLPNFISEVSPEKLINRESLFEQLETFLQQLTLSSVESDEQQSEENINYMSQIENQNYPHNQHDFVKEKRQLNYALKKQQENHQQNNAFPQQGNGFSQRKFVSDNINIIQLNSIKPRNKERKDSNSNTNANANANTTIQPKRSKQSIEAIKRKARQNLKDRDLSNSRKMELSRSIENATDILNKIQQRSSRI